MKRDALVPSFFAAAPPSPLPLKRLREGRGGAVRTAAQARLPLPASAEWQRRRAEDAKARRTLLLFFLFSNPSPSLTVLLRRTHGGRYRARGTERSKARSSGRARGRARAREEKREEEERERASEGRERKTASHLGVKWSPVVLVFLLAEPQAPPWLRNERDRACRARPALGCTRARARGGNEWVAVRRNKRYSSGAWLAGFLLFCSGSGRRRLRLSPPSCGYCTDSRQSVRDGASPGSRAVCSVSRVSLPADPTGSLPAGAASLNGPTDTTKHPFAAPSPNDAP